MVQNNHGEVEDWFGQGYKNGYKFAVQEADYDELAAIFRAAGIPNNWDIFRAEIVNMHLGVKHFDFQMYAAGFARACIEFFEKI
jgi:hypothetical protein